MLTHTQEQFFVLLRAGLWDKPVDTKELSKDIDWKKIYIIARQQTVVGLIADAINTLPQELLPPKTIQQRFIRHKLTIEYHHIEMNSVLKQVVEKLNAHNIPHVLLKGQGVAQNYPHPNSRTCGDIDIYIGLKNYEKSKRVLIPLSDNPDAELEENRKHASIKIRGIEIEIHRIASSFSSPKINDKFQAYTQLMLDTAMECGTNAIPLEKWNNAGTTINIPNAEFNAIFQVIHMLNHFINSGIGLRQLCDWTMLLNTHQIKDDDIVPELQTLKLAKVWTGIASVANQYLGLPIEKIPAFSQSDKDLAEKILRIIFMTGNFGQFDKASIKAQDKRYIIHKWKRFKYHLGHFPRIFNIFPQQVIYYSHTWFKDGLNSFFKEQKRNN